MPALDIIASPKSASCSNFSYAEGLFLMLNKIILKRSLNLSGLSSLILASSSWMLMNEQQNYWFKCIFRIERFKYNLVISSYMEVETVAKKWGSSIGVILPKSLVEARKI